jgi:lactoylglutathione lyase
VRIGATLRLELFVDDLAASLDFYRRVLGFRPGPSQPGGYTPLEKGSVHLALNLRSDLPDGPIRIGASERPGLGVEIVLEVDDVAATCQHVAAQQWPLAAELQRRPWGLTDFRVSDPDGCRRESGPGSRCRAGEIRTARIRRAAALP